MSSKKQRANALSRCDGRRLREDGYDPQDRTEDAAARSKKRVRFDEAIASKSLPDTQAEAGVNVCTVQGCKWNSPDYWAFSRHVAAHREKVSRLREVRRKREELREKSARGPYARPLHRQLVAPGGSGGAKNLRDNVLLADDVRSQKCIDHGGEANVSYDLVPAILPVEESGHTAADSESAHTDELHDELPALDVEKATSNDLGEAAKQLIMGMVPKVGRFQVDRLLQVVLHEKWAGSAAALRSAGTSSVGEIFADSDRSLAEDIQKNGFFRATVQSPRCGNLDSRLDLFMRSPLQVIKNQLKQASKKDRNFFFDPVDEINRFNERVHGHPMSGNVAWESFEAIKQEVMSSAELSTVWVPGESFVAFLQLYSDVSCMSLKTSAFSFYPLHISILNFVPSEREGAIRSGQTVVAYLPTAKLWPTVEQTRVLHERKFTVEGEPLTSYRGVRDPKKNPNSSKVGGTDRCAPRQSQEILAESLAVCLHELREIAKRGVTFEDGDGKRRRAHLAIASYVADTPEVVCVTCLIGGHCPRCTVPKDEMWIPGHIGEARTAADTEKALSGYRSSTTIPGKDVRKATQRRGIAQRGQADDDNSLRAQGLTSQRPSTFDWPFSRAHPTLDPYRIMRVDVMHTFPLGIQKEILNLASKRLKSENLHTTAFRTQSGKMRMFKTVRRSILSAANMYLRRIEEEAPSIGLHVDFARGKAATATDGLFSENGIASMLEAKDLKNVAQVMPFVGALIDRLCGVDRNGSPVTSVFVKYVELEHTISRRGMDEKGFTEKALNQLQEQVMGFKKVTYETFKEHQASGFNFPKWHAMEHVAQDIADLGICSNYSADAFEYSHTVFKAFNRAGSQRKDTTLRETAERVAAAEVRNRRLHDYDRQGELGRRDEIEWADSPQSHTGSEGCPNPAMVRYLTTGKRPENPTRGLGHEAKVSDACTLASTRSKKLSFNFGEIAAAVETIASLSNHSERCGKDSSCHDKRDVSSLPAANQFVAAVGGYALAKKVLDIIEGKYGGAGTAGLMRKNMHIVKSARVAGFRCPTLEDVVDDRSTPSNTAEIFLEDTGDRFAQKIVSALSYSGRSNPLQDTVLVEGDEPLLVTGGGHPRRHMWVAKVLLFLSVSTDRGDVGNMLAHLNNQEELGDAEDKEVAVVRYYQVVPRREIDSVDAALACIRLTWAMDADNEEPWVDVIPASSIRGRLHVVPAFDIGRQSSIHSNSRSVQGSLLDSDSEEESNGDSEAVFSGSHDWKKRQFYINRFRVDPRDIPYHVVDK